MTETPNPGSDEALALGCKCPVLDNAHGKGYMGVAGIFVYREDCPVHAAELAREPDAAAPQPREGVTNG